MTSTSESQTTWVTCTTHAAKFPAGWEEGHKSGPLGEQNTPGKCVFDYGSGHGHDDALALLMALTGCAEHTARQTLRYASDKPSAGSVLAGQHVRYHRTGDGRMWFTITPA